VVVVPDLGREGPWRAPVLLADRASGRLAVNLGELGDDAMTTLDWADAESREILRVDAEALRVLYVALTRAEQCLVLPVPPRAVGRGFYQYLGTLLAAPTDVLSADDLGRRGSGVVAPADPASAGETLAAWRGRNRALIARGGAAAPAAPEGEAPPAGRPTRAARQHAAAIALARAAFLLVDLGRPDDAHKVVAALGARRGARREVVDEAARLLARALATPTLARARRASWLARDVPVAVVVDGAVVEDRLDLLFEEPGGLVVVQTGNAVDGASPGLPAATLAAALGRPVREILVLDLADA
jgi:hypothetical protein